MAIIDWYSRYILDRMIDDTLKKYNYNTKDGKIRLQELLSSWNYDGIIKTNMVFDEIIINIKIVNSDFRYQFEKNILYIIKLDVLNNLDCNDKNLYNFIVIESSYSSLNLDSSNHNNLIFLPSDVDENTISNQLALILNQSTLNYLKMQELYEFLSKETYLESLLDKTFQMLGNPIQCTNHSHKIIGERYKESTNIKIWNKVSGLGYVDEDVIDNKFYENVMRMNETKNYVITSRDDTKIILFPMFARNYYLGCIAVSEEYKSIQDNDIDILKVVAQIISIKYAENNWLKIEDSSYYNSILEDLIEKKITNQNELQIKLKARNWDEKKYNRIILFKNNNFSSENIKYTKRKINNISDAFKVMLYDDYFFILEEYNHKTNESELFHNNLLNYITKSKFTAGISNTFNGLLNLSLYYSQAQKALQYNDIFNLKQPVTYYSNFYMTDFLKEIKDKVDCESFFNQSVIEIEEYDKQNKTELGKTLLEYLINDKSIQKTCSNMYLHKNTINYRINKIKDLFDIDFEDDIELFSIQLSLLIKNLPKKI